MTNGKLMWKSRCYIQYVLNTERDMLLYCRYVNFVMVADSCHFVFSLLHPENMPDFRYFPWGEDTTL